jgi:thymidylate synthase
MILNDSINAENFSKVYPVINKYIIENGDGVESRNGFTREILNFKTTITNPYMRSVGVAGRDINPFFLIAEAIWIFRGRRDVELLAKFNSRMKDYSDDKKVFHAPYGFRMRNYGVDSSVRVTSPENNGHHAQQMLDGIDQISEIIEMLEKDSLDRRAVVSIWDSNLDLNVKSKDIPCNDLLMFKIRNGFLHTTISNRSNDLHWGLPTNIFQFSFLSEIISNILNVNLGTQTHNSQSLHLYADNEISWRMYEHTQFSNNVDNLYDFSEFSKIDMNFEDCENYKQKLSKVDKMLGLILSSVDNDEKLSYDEITKLNNFSSYLYLCYQLMHVYLEYKASDKNDENRIKSIVSIIDLQNYYNPKLDIINLSLNFFVSKLNDKSKVKGLIRNPLIGNL